MVFYHNINPVAFTLFGADVYWYGILFVLGFIAAYFMFRFLVKERGVNLNVSDIDDFFIWLIVSVLIGARLFYVLIYNLKYFLAFPAHIFYFWEGGLSFHGALTGAVIMGIIFCKVKKVNFYDLADPLVVPLAFGLIFGRIANFINGELYGRITSLPWGVKFPGADGFRHPSQIYESFKNFVIFMVLWNVRNKKFPKGVMFWLFVVMYGVFRFLVEFVRQPDFQIGDTGFFFGWMSMGQILCLIMVLVGSFFIYRIYHPKK